MRDTGIRHLLHGAMAGMLATVAFTAVHQAIISNIWPALVPMLVAGALCGTSIAWSYQRLFAAVTVRRWFAYNAVFILLLALLAVTSVVAFDPMVDIATLLASREPPRDLIGRAMPVTLLYAALGTGAIWTVWSRRVGDLPAVAVTCLLIIGALGLNLSILGLVHVTAGVGWLLAEVLLLVVILAGVYSLTVLALHRAAITP